MDTTNSSAERSFTRFKPNHDQSNAPSFAQKLRLNADSIRSPKSDSLFVLAPVKRESTTFLPAARKMLPQSEVVAGHPGCCHLAQSSKWVILELVFPSRPASLDAWLSFSEPGWAYTAIPCISSDHFWICGRMPGPVQGPVPIFAPTTR